MRKKETESAHQNAEEFRRSLIRLGMVLAGGNTLLLAVCAALCGRSGWWLLPSAAASMAGNLMMFRFLERKCVQSIGNISRENDTIRLNLKNARLSALVSQLNPHFLFNALQLLQDEVVNGTKENSCQIVVSLSNMFRYASFNTEAVVRLQEEIRFARDYLSICEQVYEGNLAIKIQVPETLYDYTVPKFILQPVLENSMKHGFGSAPYGNHIRLTAQREDAQLLIEISDDGKNMTEDQLKSMRDALQSSGTENKNGGIGLRNVHQRIRLICGEAYGMTLERGDPQGLRVILRLPCILA